MSEKSLKKPIAIAMGATFAAALLNSQPMGFYMPAQLISDAAKNGVTVLPIDVNYSSWECTLEENSSGKEPKLRPGMRMAKRLLSPRRGKSGGW